MRKSAGGVFAILGLLLLLSSCGTVNGESAGDIAGNVKDKVGGALDSVGAGVSKVGDNVNKGLEKKFGKDVIDPDKNLDRQDYVDNLMPQTPSLRTSKQNEPAIPDVSQLLINPKAPTVGKDKLITLNVTEDIPLKEVLVELARRADIDIEIDPNIKGGIIFRAKDKPFSEVIDRICELTGLRYSVENGVLKVERDFPYVKNYHVDFLNLDRSNSGSTNISTQLFGGSGGGGGGSSGGGSAGGSSGGGGGGGGGSLTSGSQSTLKSQYDGDLWKAVEENIKNILAKYGTNSPGISEASASRTASDDGLGEILGEGAPAGVGQPTKVAPAPSAKAPKVASQGADASDIVPSGSSLLSVNRQAGVVAVLANQRQHREIEKYLDQIKRQQSAQVLIEAKVVEVTLNKEHRSGIDWNLGVKKLTGNTPNFSLSSNYAANPLSTQSDTSSNFFTFALPSQEVLGINGLNLDSFVQFTQTFGVTRTLSSPRINAINNQQAVLSFAKNLVYFQVQIQQNSTTSTAGAAGTTNQLNVSSTPNTVPIGVILTLQPSINLDTNEITMNVRPTLTRQKGTIEDPAVTLQAKQAGVDIKSEVPIIEVRELDSILKIKSGQVMVIGGLMEERVNNEDTGMPYLSDIPYFGNLFKQTAKSTDVVETVIFIKATIVPGFGVDPADKRIYRKFTNDPRPLAF